jgi:hypothetical protein
MRRSNIAIGARRVASMATRLRVIRTRFPRNGPGERPLGAAEEMVPGDGVGQGWSKPNYCDLAIRSERDLSLPGLDT